MTEARTTPKDRRRWLILALLGLAQLMVVLDVTVVNIALPTAQKALHFSDANRQWIVTAYALAFGGLLLLGGRLGDLFGRKRVLIVGLLGFAVASAVGGLAQGFPQLVAARALQGAFGALLAPATLSLLTTTFSDPSERGKAFGIYGAIAAGGGAVGLLLGGLLTEYLSWRWCLYVNLALAVPAILGSLVLLRNEVQPGGTKIDLPGTLAASSGLVALVYGFSRAETDGWGSPVTIGLLAAAVALLSLFVVIERRVERPLLPLRVVLDRVRGGSYIAVGVVGAGMFGVFLFLTYYLQQTLGFSPVETGVAFLPQIAVLAVTANLATIKLLPRIGPRLPMAAGMMLAAVGMVLLAQVGVHSTYAAHVLPGLLVVGMGLGLVMAPAMSSATFGVAAGDAGVASATVNTMQQVGGSVGTALLSTLAASAASGFMAGKAPTAAVAAQAAVHGYTVAFWWSAGIFALGAIVCGLLMRSGVQTAPATAEAAEPVLLH